MIDPAITAFPIEHIARKLGATPSAMPDLWNLTGFPEMTTNQLYDIATLEKYWTLDFIARQFAAQGRVPIVRHP